MTAPPAKLIHRPPRLIPKVGGWDNFQRKYAPYIFISPFFLLFFVFGLFPICSTPTSRCMSGNPAAAWAT